MSFQLLLQAGFYSLLLPSQKRQTTCEGNLMPPPPTPPPPPATRKGQQSQIPHEILFVQKITVSYSGHAI